MIPAGIKPEHLVSMGKNTMVEHCEIEFTEVGSDYLCAKMPVNSKTVQPMRMLHGGASVVLAETLGSVGAHLLVNRDTHYCVGLEVNANHLRGIPEGQYVYGKATILHAGKTTQVWEIKLQNAEGKLTCVSRITMAVLEKVK
ncbi:MAG: hotdog fold thioesterase [Bernardetiaceae bacterium]|nr:hotdog fold thioesterase [Bernardetiaceae bacterium]